MGEHVYLIALRAKSQVPAPQDIVIKTQITPRYSAFGDGTFKRQSDEFRKGFLAKMGNFFKSAQHRGKGCGPRACFSLRGLVYWGLLKHMVEDADLLLQDIVPCGGRKMQP
ncbi:hypothetical protein [Gemmiger sp.]|uniref:hypothetical protein n=1 Tax=Gemmiger sp. TaxID=2049027 RepID=UPI002A9150AF|nr:hypothetical protein [Gemmiger sp.]